MKGKNLKNVVISHFHTLNGKIFCRDEESIFLGLEPSDTDSLVGISDEIKNDFDMYYYNIERATVGDVFRGPKLKSIYADLEIKKLIDYIWFNTKLDLNFNTIYQYLQDKQLTDKYWGNTQHEWYSLITDYLAKIEIIHVESTTLAAESQTD